MSQAEKLAKTARENLAAALNALQTSEDVPAELMQVADIIAQCMGVLHRIERTQGADLTGKEIAYQAVKKALDHLQTLELSHPALDVVMEKVAGSLASVHGLSRLQAPTPAAAPQPFGIPQPPPAAPPSAPHAAPPPAHGVTGGGFQPAPVSGATRPGNTAMMPASPSTSTQPAVTPASVPSAGVHPGNSTQVMANAQAPAAFPAPSFGAPLGVGTLPIPSTGAHPPHQAPQAQAAPAFQAQQAPQFQAQPAAPPPQAQAFPAQQQSFQQAAPPAQVAQQARPQAPFQPPGQPTVQIPAQGRPSGAPAPAGSESGNVVVELGTHSVSNFYKGLGGNDVIEHGGLFVATYRIPKMGTSVKLRVLLPGDYEFMATGVVQWIRDPHSGGESNSEPGFGARLTQITPEGRQLVYRYTRNREPMFYDDL